jgi:mono/diheme cytochrome c family protein
VKEIIENETDRRGDFGLLGEGLFRHPFKCGAMTLFVLLSLVSRQAAQAGDAGELFVKSCAACHSKDGTAQTPAARKLGVKDLSQSKLTDAQIIEQIREGKKPGQSESKMPAFKEKLSAEEIESLVAVVKQFRK